MTESNLSRMTLTELRAEYDVWYDLYRKVPSGSEAETTYLWLANIALAWIKRRELEPLPAPTFDRQAPAIRAQRAYDSWEEDPTGDRWLKAIDAALGESRPLPSGETTGDEAVVAWLKRVYDEAGGVTPALRKAYEFYLDHERGQQPHPDPDGWIPWGGGECPVAEGSEVEVRLRDGDIFKATTLDWKHGFNDGDIIAYRSQARK